MNPSYLVLRADHRREAFVHLALPAAVRPVLPVEGHVPHASTAKARQAQAPAPPLRLQPKGLDRYAPCAAAQHTLRAPLLVILIHH